MPFSAVTCLSYTGTTSLGGVLNLYSDTDSYTTAFQTNINLSAITGNECPYYINNVPDGTTQIRIFDNGTGCYCDIPIQSNNLCVSCDLDFTTYSASTIGRIIAGDLTGLCDPSITDYRIYWYNTGDTTTPIFTSGFGTEYQPYSFTHPLIGSSAIFAPAGTYVPIIDKIKLSGLTFSQTGGTGNIPAELDCFTGTTVTVDYFTCDNGGTSSDDPNYEHRVQFSGASAGVTPQALFSDFLFTATTNYFAWKFCGFAVEDRLRLTYSGSAYSEPIIIEDIVIGSNLSASDFSLNLIPKSADTRGDLYIKKVSCLTGLTRNINDTLRLEVIPNSANTQTNWDFYFQCLNTFDQNPCIISDSPYKISASTITSITGSCNTNNIKYFVSGCTMGSDDFSRYMANENLTSILNSTIYLNNNTYTSSNLTQIFNGNLTINAPLFSSSVLKNNLPLTCSIPNTDIIEYKKYVSGGTIGIIDMTFNNITNLNHYYSSYLSVISGNTLPFSGVCGSASGAWSGTPTNPSDIRYYRFFSIAIPSNTGSTNCGDGSTIPLIYNIHPSSVVTTGTTGPNYTMRLTMPTVVNNITDPCITAGTQGYVDTINTSSTGTSNNFTGTTLTGSKYEDPFFRFNYSCSGTTSLSATTSQGFISYPKYLNETITYTGNTPTLVNSLSAQTFDFSYPRFTQTTQSFNLSYYTRYQFYYNTVLNNPSDFRDFEIYAKSFTGGTTGTDTLIYGYTGATNTYTIYDSSYFI
jgi:hypothetical protein